jgi:hypothetical protein
MAQWQRSRQPSTQGNRALGLSGYSYATPSNEAASGRTLANAAITEVFAQTALIPGFPWKDVPSLGHIMGTVTQGPPSFAPIDGLRLTLSGPVGTESGALQTHTLLTDGSGWFGSVDLLPGSYVLSPELPCTEPVTDTLILVSPGVVSNQTIVVPICEEFETYLPFVLKSTIP